MGGNGPGIWYLGILSDFLKYPPARENDQNSPKSAKWLKLAFRGSKMVPKVSKWGF